MAQYAPFTATGDGSTTTFTIGFEYIDTSDVKARVNNVATTAFSVSGSSVTFTTAPPSGHSVKIFRDTDNTNIQANFQSGSALRAIDFNDNFTQLLFVTQESTDVADTATTDAANSVIASNNAVATANAASASATSAVNTANTASTNATNAVNTANTASTNATNSVATANSAASDAATAISTANTALSTANTASTTASSASTSASNAVSTANTASTNASNAVATANSASATAAAASQAVANAAFYSPVANVAAIPSSPSNEDRVEILNSTGIGSFSPLTGLPSGFSGASDLTVRIEYSSSNSSWEFKQYFADDPEARYISNGGGTFTGAVNFDDNVIIKGDSTNGSGALTLNCEVNTHGIKIKGPPHSAGASYTLTLPNDTGSSGQALTTNGSGVTSWSTIDLSTRLALAGGTMTGDLTLAGAPTSNLHAATKAYVDNVSSSVLPLAGGTLTGALTLSGAPTSSLHAATKQYVDDATLDIGNLPTLP